MYRKSTALLLFSILLLVACSSATFTYFAETENWKANLTVTQSSNDYETQELRLEYKGNDRKSVGEITYNVDSVGSFGKSGAELNEKGMLTDRSEANPTNAKVSEHTEVEVTVKWNGKTETFKLNKQ